MRGNRTAFFRAFRDRAICKRQGGFRQGGFQLYLKGRCRLRLFDALMLCFEFSVLPVPFLFLVGRGGELLRLL